MTSSRIVYLNGDFVPFAEAKVPVMDRLPLRRRHLRSVGGARWTPRRQCGAPRPLDRSLGEIGIANPHDAAGWERLQMELVRRNDLTEGLVYMQVTRGVAERDFAFPPPAPRRGW